VPDDAQAGIEAQDLIAAQRDLRPELVFVPIEQENARAVAIQQASGFPRDEVEQGAEVVAVAGASEPSMIQTVNVPLPLGVGAEELPAHAGTPDADDEPPPVEELPPPPWPELPLLPQPAAASATVAAQTANMVTRFMRCRPSVSGQCPDRTGLDQCGPGWSTPHSMSRTMRSRCTESVRRGRAGNSGSSDTRNRSPCVHHR
jgi:hypothetical protein